MYFGHGVYGVEAASRLYFGKSAKDLSLEEAALIAGILQGNVRQSPYVNMEAALRRRNYTLGRMADVGFITADEAEAAKKKPIVVAADPPAQTSSAAPYFLEEVRKELESRYGAKQLYENGLSMQTALDLRLQEAATHGARRGPAADRQAARLPQAAPQRRRRRARDRELPPAALGPADARRRDRSGRRDRVDGAVDPAARRQRCASRSTRRAIAWTGKPAPAQLVTPGDLDRDAARDAIDGRHVTRPARSSSRRRSRARSSRIDNRTGQIRAMVGGYSFERSKFNRATQAYRQVGSAFKPIVYTAAIDRGYTPVTLLMDTPAASPAAPASRRTRR